MHEGAWSSRLGLPGRPGAAEDVIVARDVILAELTGARVHFLHVSTAGAVEMIRVAKARGLAVTAEAAPHHFTLTDECCATFDPVFKVHPPRRTAADVAAVRAGLVDGTIDAIATDHAPHPVHEKERAFEDAPPGMLGLETSLALVATELVGPGTLSWRDALALLSWRPAALAGIAHHGRPVAPGEVANLCVIDPTLAWEVDPLRLASKSRNTPFAGRTLTGKVRHTILRGTAVVIDGESRR
jgi:dihydroorotase